MNIRAYASITFVLTTQNCAALVPTDNLKSGVRRGGGKGK